MVYLRSIAFAAALLVYQAVAAPLQPSFTPLKLTTRSGVEDIELRPIARSSKKRDQVNNLAPQSTTLHLDYVDELTLVEGKPFLATLAFGPKKPALLLEHFDGLLQSIRCSSSGIYITFVSSQHVEWARNAWSMPEFIVVTSHEGCNADGVRVPYLVSGVSFNEKNTSAMLSAKGISWVKASKDLAVDFSYRESHNGLDIDSYSPSPALLKKRDTTKDLSFSVVNTNIFTIADTLSNTAALSFTQKCVSCVGNGTLTLAEGNVTLRNEVSGILGSIFDPKPNLTIADLASNAEITVIFNNFTASFEFETSIQLGETFNYHILGPAGVGFPGFSIPGLFSIGPSFDPLIVAQLQLFQPVSFTYGFNFSVPDGSGFQIDMIDLANSQKLGFGATTFTPLPFTLLNFTPGVNVSIAFRPVISIGVNLLGIDIDPVTVFADIPKYVVGLVPLAHVDDNCQPLATNATGGGEHLRLSSDFVLDLGVGAMVQLPSAIAFMPSIPILSKVLFPFSTCLGGFGAGAGSLTLPALSTAIRGNFTMI